jgi:hypothetical protein
MHSGSLLFMCADGEGTGKCSRICMDVKSLSTCVEDTDNYVVSVLQMHL